MQISGIATVPSYYEAENGETVQIRPQDIQSAITNSDYVPFQISHETYADAKGDAYALRMNSKGGMYYGASINDDSTEQTIQTIFDNGMIPNVSVRMMPLETAAFEKHIYDNGEEYYTVSEWKLNHIALVENGRCTPEQGCGIFDYQVLNSSKGDKTMTDSKDDVKTEELAIELSKLKGEVSNKDSEIAKLNSSVKDLELALSEANKTISQHEEQKLEEKRNMILKLDEGINAEELKEIKDSKALELMLTGLRDRTTRKAKANQESNEETLVDKLNEFEKAVHGY